MVQMLKKSPSASKNWSFDITIMTGIFLMILSTYQLDRVAWLIPGKNHKKYNI